MEKLLCGQQGHPLVRCDFEALFTERDMIGDVLFVLSFKLQWPFQRQDSHAKAQSFWLSTESLLGLVIKISLP